MIASHYAAPVDRVLVEAAALRDGPSMDAAEITQLEPGAPFLMLDDSSGWAWGYAGEQRQVGYVPADSLTAPG